MTSFRKLAVVLAVALAAACSGGSQPKPAATAPRAAAPSPTPTPGRVAPALVQVENAPDARPQSGIQNADIVYEYLTEGGITRFSVIYFNPSGAQKIEPVRSARLVTLKLLGAYQAVLFYSGASDVVVGKIYGGSLPSFDEKADGGKYFSRDSSRQAPHNLFTSGDQLKAGLEKSGRRVLYDLPATGEPAAAGEPVPAFHFQETYQHAVGYSYSDSAKTYGYRADTGPLIDAALNQPLAITNVVLVHVAHHGMGYTEDVAGAEGIDFDLQGTGPADVYTRGQHFAATWDLSTPDHPLRLVGADGKDLTLPKGLTFIHLVDPGMAVTAG